MRLVNEGKFSQLFREELGWNRPDHPPISVHVDDGTFVLHQVAGFRGIRVWTCPAVPDGRTQRLIDHEVKKISDERLIIFANEKLQEWRWPQSSNPHGSGQPRLVTHRHVPGTPNPALQQRLALIEIGIDEDISVVDLLRRMRAAFDADKITKTFYDKFLAKHKELVKAIRGIEEVRDREWYSALLMNRLMFIYFLQRKGFMDDDRDYLRNRLNALRAKAGSDRFYEFYRHFLIPLFHESLGAPGHKVEDAVVKSLVGDVPYINGGIFAVHEIEKSHVDIRIPDGAFTAIFDLFDAYQWHLDDRPTANPNEINPDVLGYIFEQFINQKEQGAYYTKEDVTHFMTASTLLPVFIERLQEATNINPWARVAHEPIRYVWESVQHGVTESLTDALTAEGMSFPRPLWNEKAPSSHGLPGETWWEVDRRRTTFESLIKTLKLGHIKDSDAGVTANLDLESLAIDVIDGMDTPADIVSAWNVLTGLKIVDPTCGSGAFLFAALKILQSLYGAVIDAARKHSSTAHEPALADLLSQVDAHVNADYFILKHATLNNLYGVDLMKEATEVARLRLFLKLVSAVHERKYLEPLPDLDFNIKPGNTLVGAVTAGDIEDHNDLLSFQALDEVLAEAAEVSEAYQEFRDSQETGDNDDVSTARATLVKRLTSVRDRVNRHFHSVHGVSGTVEQWVDSHSPFHWFIEFPEVFSNGGFDIVIGNPPYVAKNKITSYAFKGFRTDGTPDIYAPCTERSAQITRPDGRMALIIPISAQFSNDFADLRTVLEERFDRLWVSAFSRNPSALFSAGLGVRSTIIIGSGKQRTDNTLHVTKTHRWVDEYRPALFETLTYVDAATVRSRAGWVRLPDSNLGDLFGRLLPKGNLGQIVRNQGTASMGFKSIVLYWLSVFEQDPASYTPDLRPTPQTSIGRLRMGNARDAKLGLSILASKLAFVWWYCTGDDFHATNGGLKSTPVDVSAISQKGKERLIQLADELTADFPNHVAFTKYAGKWMGNYVHSEMRDITDEIDRVLARELGYEDLLPALEYAYYCVYKPTGERNGTLRYDIAFPPAHLRLEIEKPENHGAKTQVARPL